jgi:hypothetical protein
MNEEIKAEAALFPEMEYINGIFVAVYVTRKKGPNNLAYDKHYSIQYDYSTKLYKNWFLKGVPSIPFKI